MTASGTTAAGRPKLSAAQRRAYIATSRRSQPISELERKSRKARGRRNAGSCERADLSLAKSHDWQIHYFKDSEPPPAFCSQCSEFGTWDVASKSYVAPPVHKIRCVYAPDDGPYPGWAIAGRIALTNPEQSR